METGLNIRFYLDPESGTPHIWGHGVAEDEVDEVMRHPIEDVTGRDEARTAIGQTEAGRYLRVIYVPDEEPDSYFVITAYPISGKPLRAFRKRQRRRKK